MLTGCEACDMHGPELPTTATDLLDFHRAVHDLGRTLMEVAAANTSPLTRLLRKATK